MMPYCACCRRPFECQGDTGGTSDATPQDREERLLWESLLRNRRGHFAGTQMRARDDVGVARFTPSQARYLAVMCSERYPAGVVTLHLGERGQHLAVTGMVGRAAGMSQAEDVTFR